ncbi:hypothetical protein ISCGN_016944 [Ixodes scapularis]
MPATTSKHAIDVLRSPSPAGGACTLGARCLVSSVTTDPSHVGHHTRTQGAPTLRVKVFAAVSRDVNGPDLTDVERLKADLRGCGPPDRMTEAQELSFAMAATNGGLDGGNICRDFLRKVCHRGSRCKFVHPDGQETEEARPSADPVFCHDFQNSECFRPNCKFLHCSRQEEELYRTTGRLPSAQGIPPPEPPTVVGMIPPVCKDFLKGDCRRAGRCKFRHLGEEEPEAKRRALDEDMGYRVLQQENAILRRKHIREEVGMVLAAGQRRRKRSPRGPSVWCSGIAAWHRALQKSCTMSSLSFRFSTARAIDDSRESFVEEHPGIIFYAKNCVPVVLLIEQHF